MDSGGCVNVSLEVNSCFSLEGYFNEVVCVCVYLTREELERKSQWKSQGGRP
jgi:hypothetical protein